MTAARPLTPQHAGRCHVLPREGGRPGSTSALTLPIFLVYQVGVVGMRVRNATDFVTSSLLEATNGDTTLYLLVTFAIGVAFAAVFALLGRGRGFRVTKLVQVDRRRRASSRSSCASPPAAIVGKLNLGASPLATQVPDVRTRRVVLSCGAGFYGGALVPA